jgi:hypothetical protein
MPKAFRISRDRIVIASNQMTGGARPASNSLAPAALAHPYLHGQEN